MKSQISLMLIILLVKKIVGFLSQEKSYEKNTNEIKKDIDTVTVCVCQSFRLHNQM